MVLKFGMGKKSGLAALQDTNDLSVSEQAKKDITDDIRQILDTAEASARNILSDPRDTVRKLASILLSRQTMTETEINDFFQSEIRNDEKGL